MSAALREREPVIVSVDEQPVIDRLDVLLDASPLQPLKLVGPAGDEIVLPETLHALLRRIVHHLASDEAVAILPIHKELTTQQAADLLNVSRPYLIRLLDNQAIPYHRVGTHRRILLGDVLEYRRSRDEARRHGLRVLTQMSQELGLYSRAEEPS